MFSDGIEQLTVDCDALWLLRRTLNFATHFVAHNSVITNNKVCRAEPL